MTGNSSTLTGAQREYLREKQYIGDMDSVTERKLRSRLRQRIIRGIRDFDIIFHHLDEKDWGQIFAEADPESKETANLTPEEYLDTLPEQDRLRYFGRGTIDEEDLQEHFEGLGTIEPDPYKFFEGGNEATKRMFGDEHGEPDIQAIARHYRYWVTRPYYPRETIDDNSFRRAAVSMIAFLFLGFESGLENPDDEPSVTTNALIIDGIDYALQNSGSEVRVAEWGFHYTNYHHELEEAREKLEAGEGVTQRQIELLDENGGLPEDMRFRPIKNDSQ